LRRKKEKNAKGKVRKNGYTPYTVRVSRKSEKRLVERDEDSF
jgi:hypothetical protein